MQVNFNLFNLFNWSNLKSYINNFFIFFMEITDKTKNTCSLMVFSFILLGLLILCFALNLFSGFSGFYLYKKIVVFDFQGTYTTFLSTAAHRNLSQDEIAVLGKKFPIAVTQAVARYSKEHNAIVFTKAAIMTGTKGAIDVTYEIQQLIAKEMQVLAKEIKETKEIKEIKGDLGKRDEVRSGAAGVILKAQEVPQAQEVSEKLGLGIVKKQEVTVVQKNAENI